MKSLSLTYQALKSVHKEYHKTNEEIQNESVLIEKAKTNLNFFKPLYEKYHEPIFRFIYKRCNSIEVAQDICQQVFLKAMRKIESYQHKGLPFSSWLYRIAFNECNNYFKQNSKDRALNLSLKDFEIFEDDKEEKELLIQKMKYALSQLKTAEIQLIEMRFFEGRSVREISEILEISESNVKVKTHRAMEKLRAFANQG